MADRWMDERDRQSRERDLRRSNDDGRSDYGRGGYGRSEDRSWSGGDDDRGYGADDPEYSAPSDLIMGGAYGRDPSGPPNRYRAPAPRFSSQDYTRGYGDDADRRQYARPNYGRRDWETERDGAWARFDPEDGYRDTVREARQSREDWLQRRGDERRGDGPGDFLSRAGERLTNWFRGDHLMRGSRDEDYGAPRRYREDFGREARSIPERDYDANHRGRGPAGYKRTDARISDDVHDALSDDRWLDASHINVEVKDGEVTLSGAVDNREAKHRAERLIEDLSGVRHVQNNLRVNPDLGVTGAGRGLGSNVLEAQMRREAWETDPSNNGASGQSGRTSTGAAADRNGEDATD